MATESALARALRETQERERSQWAAMSDEERRAAGGFSLTTGGQYTQPRGYWGGMLRPGGIGDNYREGSFQPLFSEWLPGGQRTGLQGGRPSFYGMGDPSAIQNRFFAGTMARVRSAFGRVGTLSSSLAASATAQVAGQAEEIGFRFGAEEAARRTNWEMEFANWWRGQRGGGGGSAQPMQFSMMTSYWDKLQDAWG